MTDKQIIINGVDVSGCDFLAQKDDYCSYSGVTYAYKGQCMCSDEEMCKEHPKCFYKKVLKQLKSKEQECEKWKNAYEVKEDALAESEEECEELEEQRNQLKKEIEALKKLLKDENCHFDKIKELTKEM